jgi:hypothetical protein
MAIVSRRTLQRLILENAAFLSVSQRQYHADAINRGGAESLSAEWEILVLNSLSKLAAITHEPQLGTRRPDVLATITGEPPQTFVADITTAFEESDNDRNPIQALAERVSERARRLGLSGNRFQIDAQGERHGERGKQRMQLALPHKTDLDQFFLEHVAPFVDAAAAERDRPREERVTAGGADFTLSFHPGRRFAGLTHPSFTIHYSTTNNPLFRKLRDKTSQLKETSFEGPTCVILCAADAVLPRRGTGPGFGLREITTEFFRQNTSLSAVVTLSVIHPLIGSGLVYECEVYPNARAKQPAGDLILSTLQRMPELFPTPLRDGRNAALRLEAAREKIGRHYYGDFIWSRSMKRSIIKISARELMEYLAGRVTRDIFIASLGGNEQIAKIFAQQLREGRLLDRVELERRPDEDDDLVVFRFGAPDPALAPLKPS